MQDHKTTALAYASGQKKPYVLPPFDAGLVGKRFATGYSIQIPATCIAPCLWCGTRVAAVIATGEEVWLEIAMEWRGKICATASPVHSCAGQERWRAVRNRGEVPAFYPGEDGP